MLSAKSTYKLIAYFFVFALLTLPQCQKFEPVGIAYVSTDGITSIGFTSSVANGTLIDIGEGGIIQHGHCWGTSENPTTTGSKSSLGSINSTGSFTSDLMDLAPGTNYFVRSYVETSDKVIYGANRSFFTQDAGVPAISTHEPSAVSRNSFVCGGDVISDGGFTITDRGVCWNRSGNPIPGDENTNHEGTGNESFGSVISGLEESTQYYVRAFASNSMGTGFGEERIVITTTFASVITSDISDLQPYSVNCGGTIITDGGAEIIEQGVCWGVSPYPTLDNEHQAISGDGSSFSASIQGLEAATQYYIRAYAININGEVYGDNVQFITPIVDSRDGRIYPVILIGDQYWMAENLDVGTRIDISQGQSDNSILEKYCYDNDPGNCETYGGLYSWPEMMQYTTSESVRGVCPAGWHLPSDQEWKILEQALNMPSGELDLYDWRGTAEEVGAQLKATGTSLWNAPNNASNSSQFNAIPGGYSIEDSDDFGGLRDFTTFWTSTLVGDNTVIYRLLDNESTGILRTTGYAPNGTPVRCVKD